MTLTSATTSTPTFPTPIVAANTVVTLSLTVTDNGGAASTADSVSITVMPLSPTNVTVGGGVTHDRVPFNVTPTGLNYIGVFPEASAGINVEARGAGTTCVLASGRTDSNGVYSMQVPGNVQVAIRAIARLQSTGPPVSWDIAVRNWNADLPEQQPEPYSFTGQAFNSSAPNGNQNVNIPHGWNAVTRQPTGAGARQSAPFTILHTIRRALVFLSAPGINPAITAFPPLNIHWGEQVPIGDTFYSSVGGDSPDGRYISLAGQANSDIDEFDAHTIAHEFGHYIEDRFSRSDSVGGAHTLGDRLDPRVSFGEGFGYAFAAMVLNDPVVRDAIGNQQSNELNFSVETEGPGPQGWFSEGSVQEILWDLYDPAGESGDTVSLPFGSLWTVLAGAQADTEAFTSIFPFITALRAQGQQVPGIDALVTSEIITAANMTAFAVGEGNDGGRADILPLYDNISRPGNVDVISTNQFGSDGNKLGARRYLRFAPTSSGTANLNVTGGTAGVQDIDVLVFNRGNLIAQGITANNTENVSFPFTNGQIYIFEVYDCANAGCNDTSTPGNTTITVTLQ